MKKCLFVLLLFFIGCTIQSRTKWPDGKIPFVLSGFSIEEETEIVKCMLLWEVASNGKIEFILGKYNDTKPLLISKIVESGDLIGGSVEYGYSYDGLNIIFLPYVEEKIILHELAHSIGLLHEFNRPDRDLYITIKKEPLEDLTSIEKIQFLYNDYKLYDYKEFPFDYRSITMYDEYYIDGHGNEVGGDTISIIDALKVQYIYSEVKE
jgi:hypothetical protein